MVSLSVAGGTWSTEVVCMVAGGTWAKEVVCLVAGWSEKI